MKKLQILTGIIISLFVLQGIVEAASISSRVRVLEANHLKQDRQIKQQTREQQALKTRVDEGLKEITGIKLKVEKMLEKTEQPTTNSPIGRYTFP